MVYSASLVHKYIKQSIIFFSQKISKDMIKLYTVSSPRGDLPILVAPFNTSDEVPINNKIITVVKLLRIKKSQWPSKIWAEGFKKWLDETIREEDRNSTN